MFRIHTTLVNEDEDTIFSEWSETDDISASPGDLYRFSQSEYGRCTSSVYADTPNGPKKIGWYFVSRDQYSDTNEPYLRGAWVTYQEVTT